MLEVKLTFKQLREIVEEIHRVNPEVDDAEVKLNVGFDVITLGKLAYYVREKLVVLFPSHEVLTEEDLKKLRGEQG